LAAIQDRFANSNGWLIKGNFPRLLPLLHTLVEERAGVRRFLTFSYRAS
jgi:hypothetical protein